MRILQIAPPWYAVPPSGYGGTERIVSILADGLVARGHDVTLLASGGSRTTARLWSVFDRPPSRALGCPAREITHWMGIYDRRHEFDVIHDHSSVVGAALAALLDGPPVVHTVHLPWDPPAAAAYRSLPGRLHIAAISRDHARRAPDGLDVHVVHNGVDLHAFPYRAAPDGAGYLAFVGRASPAKGPEVAIRVARRLGRPLRMALKVNQRVEVRFLDEVIRPALRTADVDLVINGSAPRTAAILAGATVTVAPLAWDEPFGLVLAESMASGTPVAAYRRGAAEEIVEDGVTGALAPPAHIDALCAAVGSAADLSRAACRRRAEEHFSADAMVDRYLHLYETALRCEGRLGRRTSAPVLSSAT
jgi:glycosyltransferase involved in cell wall biosynthesis